MGLNLQALMWMMNLWPRKFSGAPSSIAIAALGALITEASGVYTMYHRIADSEKNKTARYDLDSKFNSEKGLMPGKDDVNVKRDTGESV